MNRQPCLLCAAEGLLAINGQWYCTDHMDTGFAAATIGIAVLRGLDVEVVERLAAAALVEAVQEMEIDP